jgi:hypothetical protein
LTYGSVDRTALIVCLIVASATDGSSAMQLNPQLGSSLIGMGWINDHRYRSMIVDPWI